MRKIIVVFTLFFGSLLAACNEQKNSSAQDKTVTESTNKKTIVVDVRSREEWENDGHADCAVNFPLDELELYTDTLKKFNHIEVVCKSGGRAANAKEMLESMGFTDVVNKGSWENINCH